MLIKGNARLVFQVAGLMTEIIQKDDFRIHFRSGAIGGLCGIFSLNNTGTEFPKLDAAL
jgi:predicted dinucleotide-utilizing enzyme